MPTLHHLEVSAAIALLSAFSILFIGRTGVRRWIVEHAPKLISKAFDCDFCLSFWTNLFICLVVCVFTGVWGIILLPPFLTPLTRKLVD